MELARASQATRMALPDAAERQPEVYARSGLLCTAVKRAVTLMRPLEPCEDPPLLQDIWDRDGHEQPAHGNSRPMHHQLVFGGLRHTLAQKL